MALVACAADGAAPPEAVLAAGTAARTAADTTLHHFLDDLADSTDRYFGRSAAPRDTAGLDSLLAHRLDGGAEVWRERPALGFTLWPDYAFNRVDGSVWRASLGVEFPWGGVLRPHAGYAAGPDLWLGGAEYRHGFRHRGARWSLRAWTGRMTAPANRDHVEHRLATLRALVSGDDRQHYLRRDGVAADLGVERVWWRLGAGFRNVLERPLATAVTWNLVRNTPEPLANFAAARGRNREVTLEAGLRWPRLPVVTEVVHQWSSPDLGSEFDYRRTRFAAGAEIGLGRRAAVVPQLLYGRLGGDPAPQASFYMGGSRTLRSLPGDRVGGTGIALAKVDLIGTDDLLALARLPHPESLPIQGGLFAAIGAVWGPDPFGAASTGAGSWPERGAWRSEAGLSLVHQPGLPDPEGLIRFSYAWPIGPERGEGRWTLSYSRPLDAIRPIGP